MESMQSFGKTAIIDYGVGNLFSLRSSLAHLGADSVVTSDPSELEAASRLILPGVGAFADAVEKLNRSGLGETVKRLAQSGKPLLGICLGMQMLFERSFEYGEHQGLGLLKGSVTALSEQIEPNLKIPQMGWNSLRFIGADNDGKSPNRLFKYIKQGDYVYFVHSYAAIGCDDSLIATTDYGGELTAAVAYNNVYGTQFHPEKSGEVGLNILRAFLEI